MNAIFLREGRLPEAGQALEVVVNEDFAEAHHFLPGSSFHATPGRGTSYVRFAFCKKTETLKRAAERILAIPSLV